MTKKKLLQHKNSNRIHFNYIKKKFMNLTIHKRLNFTFLYIGIMVVIIVLIGLANMVSINKRLNDFYKGPYKIEANFLKAQVSMKNIENNIYRAYFTKKDNLCLQYIETTEDEYVKLETLITELADIMSEYNTANLETVNKIKTEFQKGERYRKQIIESAKKFEQEEIFAVYKNDYAPILDSILHELEELEQESVQNGHFYIMKSNGKVILSIIFFLLLIVISALSVVFILMITEKSITNPIQKIKSAMLELSRGNLEVDVQVESTDEMGVLCEAVRKTSIQLKDYISDITRIMKSLEEKDMTVKVGIEYEGDFSPIQTSLEHIIKSYQTMLIIFNEAAEHISNGSLQIAEISHVVAQGGTDQASSIGKIVEQIEQIAKEVTANAIKAENINVLSNNTVAVAEQGNQQMSYLVKAIQQMETHSDKISRIIQVINAIADQTNLLSLNASIEAARAGEAGKSFAVVANEIGKLANECQKAVKSTTESIHNTVNAMKEGAVLANDTATDFKKIVQEMMNTNQVMNLMSKESKKQAEQLNQTVCYLYEVSAITESNSAAAKDSSDMSENFILQANKLSDILRDYKLK